MSGRKMKKTTNQTNKKTISASSVCFILCQVTSVHPSLCFQSTVCLTCIKQSNHGEMIENAFKCSELEQLSDFVCSSLHGAVQCHQIRAYQMKENFTGC